MISTWVATVMTSKEEARRERGHGAIPVAPPWTRVAIELGNRLITETVARVNTTGPITPSLAPTIPMDRLDPGILVSRVTAIGGRPATPAMQLTAGDRNNNLLSVVVAIEM